MTHLWTCKEPKLCLNFSLEPTTDEVVQVSDFDSISLLGECFQFVSISGDTGADCRASAKEEGPFPEVELFGEGGQVTKLSRMTAVSFTGLGL